MAKQMPPGPKAPPDPLADFDENEADESYDPYLEELDHSLKGLEDEVAPEALPPKAPPRPEAPKSQPRPKNPAESPKPATPAAATNKNLLTPQMLPLEVKVVIGQKIMTLAELLGLEAGSLVELQKPLEPLVELMVQDRVIARGELVQFEGRLGVKILTLIGVAS